MVKQVSTCTHAVLNQLKLVKHGIMGTTLVDCYSYSTVSRSKQTKSEDNYYSHKSLHGHMCYNLLYIPPDWSFVVITVNMSVQVQVFAGTSVIIFTHNCV